MEKIITSNGVKKVKDELRQEFNFTALEYLFVNEVSKESENIEDRIVCYYLQQQYLKIAGHLGLNTEVLISNFSKEFPLWMRFYSAFNKDLYLAASGIIGLFTKWENNKVHLSQRMKEPVFQIVEMNKYDDKEFYSFCRGLIQ